MTLSRLFVGGFSAEDEWGGADRVQLSPWRASADSTSTTATGLSELLGLLCSPQDRVGVLAQPDEALAESYARLGKDLRWILCPVYAGGAPPNWATTRVQPFAVTRRLAESFTGWNEPWPFPEWDTVVRVNSKRWSHEVRRSFISFDADWVDSAQRLDSAARRLLEQGPIVIKEDFGVSGKGNCVVRAPAQLRSLVRLIEQQERAGRHGGFVLERLLDKLTDFSGHFTVHEDGRTSFDGFRQMLNVGHRYVASSALPHSLQQLVKSGSYFREVETVLAALVRERYFGPVCIDGLILRDGSVVPTLEVNARMSMGRLSLALDGAARRKDLRSVLFTLRVRAQGERAFANLLAELDRRRTNGFLLLGGSPSLPSAELRWYAGYLFNGDTDCAHDFAEFLAAARACGVRIDESFPAQALCAYLTSLQSELRHAEPTLCFG